jgi:hypothetical protein
MNGPMPLSYSEMQAWVQITGSVVLGGEWKIIRAIDNAFLEAVAVEQADRRAREKDKTSPEKPA